MFLISMITYNDIYEFSRKERYSDQLQKLPKSFIEEVSNYIKDKKENSLKDEDSFSDANLKNKKQLENAMTLFKELMLRRRKKLLNLVLIAAETGISKQDFNNMLLFEKSLFEDMMKCIENSDRQVNEMFNGTQNNVLKNKMVLFKENVEEFVDLQGNKMGPFEKGQIANISKDVVNILIAEGVCDILENN